MIQLIRGITLRKLELSEVTSNLLLASSVVLAISPLVLGDRLLLILMTVLREGSLLVDEVFTFLTTLLS
jgi:hypothetical protein